MSVTIYHNPRCSKSRQTLALLGEQGVEPEIIEYLKEPPAPETLSEILKLLGIEPMALMRRGEADFKTFVRDKELNRDEAIAIMLEHPKLIERPIVVNGKRAALGRPPENVLSIL